jgi:signal peptidase I
MLEQKNNDNVEQEPTETKQEGAVAFVWDLVKVLVVSLGIVLLVHNYIAQPFIVTGASMEPNFHTGEYLIIDDLSYMTGTPKRGDIIVFKYPKDTSQYFLKRIIGLPGEKVRVETNGSVIIYNEENPDGFVLKESAYLPNENITFPAGNPSTVQLGSEEYYVLGDNRAVSSDSRYWGPVPKKNIVGRAFIRAFPFSEFTKFHSIKYNQ